jgi:hypothetical protein
MGVVMFVAASVAAAALFILTRGTDGADFG